MSKKIFSKSFLFKFFLLVLFCCSLSYVVADPFGSPENNSRRVDWVNGGGFACNPPGSLCRIMP